jgi:DNA-binding transcriptional MerR regulator
MKAPEAFRTISEVSDWLDTPAHVLRFWESKFTQIKPVKRAGGRRYYRPEDMALLGGIKTLLHEQGMTIKGVQKMLREQGVRVVSALGPQPMDGPGGTALPDGPDEDPGAEETVIAWPGALQGPPPAADPPPAAPPVETPVPSLASVAAPPPAPRPDGAAGPPVPSPGAPPARPSVLSISVRPAPPRPVPSPPGTGAPFHRAAAAAPFAAPQAAARPLILSRLMATDPAALRSRRARIAPLARRLADLQTRLAED